MIDMDFDNIPDDPTKLQDGNQDRPKPGRGMALITGWEEHGLFKGKAHKLDLEIVAWTDTDSVGKTHTEGIFHADTTGKGHPQKRMTTLALAAALFTPADVAKWKAERQAPSIDFSELLGRPIMVEIIEEPRQKDPSKKDFKIGGYGLAMYHIHDPRVSSWPRNQTIVNQRGGLVGQWGAAAKPATPPPAPPKPATSIDDVF